MTIKCIHEFYNIHRCTRHFFFRVIYVYEHDASASCSVDRNGPPLARVWW